MTFFFRLFFFFWCPLLFLYYKGFLSSFFGIFFCGRIERGSKDFQGAHRLLLLLPLDFLEAARGIMQSSCCTFGKAFSYRCVDAPGQSLAAGCNWDRGLEQC